MSFFKSKRTFEVFMFSKEDHTISPILHDSVFPGIENIQIRPKESL